MEIFWDENYDRLDEIAGWCGERLFLKLKEFSFSLFRGGKAESEREIFCRFKKL